MQAGKPLDGQVAVVTGAGRGIGRATALALAGQGAAVAVMARSGDEIAATAAAIEADQGRALAVRVDITDAEAVRGAFARVAGELGEVDLLVNNAGRNTVFGPVGDVDPAQWWDDIGTNLLGPVLCTAAVLPAMRRRGRGRVINVVSAVAGRPNPNNSAYGCAKAALVSFTESVAAEAAGTGVAVFAFAPGPIRTRLMEDLTGDPLAMRYMGDMLRGLTYLPVDVPVRAILTLASGAVDALSGCYVDSRDDLAALGGRADEITADGLCKLRIQKPGIQKPAG
jgi:NAD(P)-dependent dehydrogenase (short-subunit alcohol dehydrogenase family)